MRSALTLACVFLCAIAPAAAQVIEYREEVAVPPPETRAPRPAPAQRAPQAVYEPPPAYEPAPRALTPTPVEERAIAAPRLHTARAGETMESIAALYGVSAADVEAMNSLIRPYEIRAGDVIVLPQPAPVIAARPIDPPPRAQQPGEPAPITPPRDDAGAHFLRPVSGRIVTAFGAQAGGRRSDGVELAARAGEPIRAAADGEVVYAGNHVQGYGDLVLVRHADGYVTAYGYARNVRVREGGRVRRGEAIAEAADRGTILFQTRRGVTAENPAPLLGE